MSVSLYMMRGGFSRYIEAFNVWQRALRKLHRVYVAKPLLYMSSQITEPLINFIIFINVNHADVCVCACVFDIANCTRTRTRTHTGTAPPFALGCVFVLPCPINDFFFRWGMSAYTIQY